MLSSSVSVRETRGLLYHLQRVRAIPRGGWDSCGTIERLVLTLAGPKAELLLDGEGNGDRSQPDHNSNCRHNTWTFNEKERMGFDF
jgi:hypothetical protein